MRSLSLLLLGATLVGCSTAPPPPNPYADAELQRMIAGKVAGGPVTCIPNYRSTHMYVIDDQRVAFRSGSTVFVNTIPGTCPGLGRGSRALVFRHLVTSNLCRGEIAEVIEPSVGSTVGSCVLGDFVPYRAP